MIILMIEDKKKKKREWKSERQVFISSSRSWDDIDSDYDRGKKNKIFWDFFL